MTNGDHQAAQGCPLKPTDRLGVASLRQLLRCFRWIECSRDGGTRQILPLACVAIVIDSCCGVGFWGHSARAMRNGRSVRVPG